MKKKGLFLSGLLFVSVLGIGALHSCDKDTNSYLEVTVANQSDSHCIPNAHVVISMNRGTIADSGYTDENGVYSTKFAAPAVFDIKAQLTVIDTPTYKPEEGWFSHRDGQSSVRLKEGETVTATVYLEPNIIHEQR